MNKNKVIINIISIQQEKYGHLPYVKKISGTISNYKHSLHFNIHRDGYGKYFFLRLNDHITSYHVMAFNKKFYCHNQWVNRSIIKWIGMNSNYIFGLFYNEY